MKVLVIGGCGAVGSNAVKTLVKTDTVAEVVIGDFNMEKAQSMAAQMGNKLSALQLDATDRDSIRNAIDGCDLVVNCVGPFYSTVENILETVIEAGVNYVDVCDDPDVTLKILKLDQKAKDAGIPAAVGAILLGQGKLKDKGVLPPEACVDPKEFIEVVKPLMDMTEQSDGKAPDSSIIFEHVDETGKITVLNF